MTQTGWTNFSHIPVGGKFTVVKFDMKLHFIKLTNWTSIVDPDFRNEVRINVSDRVHDEGETI